MSWEQLTRAAAADQLETWEPVDVPVIRCSQEGGDRVSRTAQRKSETGSDVLVLTLRAACRIKVTLWMKLGKIERVTERTMPVDEVLLVLDASGQTDGTGAGVC